MNIAPANMSTMLDSRRKDILCLVEFYESTYTPNAGRGFEPDDAVARFATETVTGYIFSTSPSIVVDYVREVFTMPSLSRKISKESNTCTVRLSNVPKASTPTIRPIANFVLNNEVHGMWMVVRLLSRAEITNPLGGTGWVMFAGKCGKPEGFDRREGSITARQDLGQIEAMIPPRVFQKDCPLDFGGTECLGTELLTDKNSAYQTAFATFGRTGCNKTHGQCTTYGNTEFFQGIRVAQIEGSFRYRPHQGLFSKIAKFTLPLIYYAFLRRKNITVGQSLEDGTPYGKAIPIVLGRWQMPGIPLQYRDDGETVHFLMAYCRGRIEEFYNIRCPNPEFEDPPVTVVKHYGDYGGAADQLEDTVFPLGGFYSKLAYITGGVIGSDIAVEEPVPDIFSIVAGIKPPKVTLLSDSAAGEGTTDTPGVYQYINLNWSDNPVDLAVFVLTDPALLNIGTGFLDASRTAKTSVYTMGAVQDDTNAERLVLPNTESGAAGVDYHRYHSTGMLIINGSIGSGAPIVYAGAATEVDYEYYDPDAPPTSTALKVRRRKRFTSNLALTEQKKALDVLYDTILPTFRGFLSWNIKGQVSIRSERPSDSSLMYAASTVGASTIKINDVYPWKLQFHENNVPLLGKVLIGVGLTTSEVRSVNSAAYTADGNSITLTASSSGTVTVSASGATLSGGSSSAPASGTVQITSDFGDVGDVITVVIDGVTVEYELEGSGINKFKIANALAFCINADRTLQGYIVAHCPVLDDTVHIECKRGVLTLSSVLAEAHDIDEETIRVMMSFAGKALTSADTTKANILNGSFKYLGNDGQTRYNQFKGTFHDPLKDFAEQPVIINDYANQDQVGKVIPLEVDLSAVDNYNQAARLLNGAAAKYGDGTDFFQWGSNGLALQLEEGDVVCVSDDSGDWINVPVRIESLSINENYEINLKGRIYSTSMFDDFVEETDVPLPSGTGFANPPASIAFNTTDFPPDGLVQSTDGTAGITSIRGGAIFPTRRFATYAFVRLIKRAGVTVNEQVATIYPDDNLEAIFEFIASAPGLYRVELEVCNQWGCNATKPTADISVVFGLGGAHEILQENGSSLLREELTVLEMEF